jgi:hypothetical protein
MVYSVGMKIRANVTKAVQEICTEGVVKAEWA